MLSSKEALEKVKNYHYADRYVFQYTEEYNIIKQDLDRLEELEKENQELIKKTDCCMWHECNKISQENTKFKKVIDILKNKKVNMFHIWVFDDYTQYKEHYPFSEYSATEDMLTFEEFNFLKEVFEE